MSGAFSTVSGGLFNALAFSGASFIFSKMDKSGYTKEMHRHDLAMEKMQAAKNEWSKNREQELDRLSKLRHDQEGAGRDLIETNKAFLTVKTKFDSTKPLLSNFYTPSKEMDEYLTFVKFLATAPVLYGIYALVL